MRLLRSYSTKVFIITAFLLFPLPLFSYQINQYLQLDVLVVIYPNSVQDTMSLAEIEQVKEEVREAQLYFWRNSGMKCNIRTDTLIINRTLELNQFWEISTGSYWLPDWSIDGTNSIRKDLADNGIANDQYDGVVVYYAWRNTSGVSQWCGGGTYGVEHGFMGRTGYTANPMPGDITTCDWLFIHEFNHQIDSMFDNPLLVNAGLPTEPLFPHADHPDQWPYGVFDNDYSFDACMLSEFPTEKWFNMQQPWGNVQAFSDTDSDGVPDSGDFPITEEMEGSSPFLQDTDEDGLDDLAETRATIFIGSDPADEDTDDDGIVDGQDHYPRDAIDCSISTASVTVDGTITEGEWPNPATTIHTASDVNLSADVMLTADGDNVYVGVSVRDSALNLGEAYWDLWWKDSVRIMIDAQCDGFKWHGQDNYDLYIAPTGANDIPAVNMGILYGNVTRDKTIIPDSAITARYRITSDGYVIEAAIPRSEITGLLPSKESPWRMQVEVMDYDTYGQWPRYAAYSEFIKFQCELGPLAPARVATVNDGRGSDVDITTSSTTLAANWPETSDDASGISQYWYAIGTTAGGSDIVDWSSVDLSTYIARAGLSLTDGATYYVSVKAENGAGLISEVRSSDGQCLHIMKGCILMDRPEKIETGKHRITVTFPEAVAGTPELRYVLSDGSSGTVTLSGSGQEWSGEFFIESTASQGNAYFVLIATAASGGMISDLEEDNWFTVDTTVDPLTGGLVCNKDGTTVLVPAGAASGMLHVVINEGNMDSAAAQNAVSRLAGAARPISSQNVCRQFTATCGGSPVTRFTGLLWITIPYADADQDGIVDGTGYGEQDLTIAYLDELAGCWVTMPSQVDPSANTVNVLASHFSTFAIFAAQAPQSIHNVVCYPNPYRPALGGYANIAHIPLDAQNVTVRIYTIAGELVRTLREGEGIETGLTEKTGRWDGKNDDGRNVASGVYICLIKSAGDKKITKIAVIR